MEEIPADILILLLLHEWHPLCLPPSIFHSEIVETRPKPIIDVCCNKGNADTSNPAAAKPEIYNKGMFCDIL